MESGWFPFPETATASDASGTGAEIPVFLDDLGLSLFSGMDFEVSMDVPENLAACRASLASCAALLAFGDILLCMILGCMCASIFSYFWKLNR